MEIIPVLDEKAISLVHKKAVEIWNEYFISIISKNQIDYMLDKFLSHVAITQAMQEGYEFYLLSEDEVFGFISVQKQEKTLFLSKLYIDANHRGKGYARKALSFLESYARKNALNSIWLTVNKYNDATIAIYKKMGFVIFDSVVNAIGSNYVMDDYYMKKQL